MKIKRKKELLNISSEKPITWKDIKNFQFEDDDIIHIGWEEPFYSENNSYDGFYYCIIERMLEETDDEYKKRINDLAELQEKYREKRYQNYLKLKEEFETSK